MTWRALVDLNQGNRGLRLYAREQLAGSLGCLAEASIVGEFTGLLALTSTLLDRQA